MPFFPDSVIQEVVEKNDIYDIISQTVHLKKTGSSYIGLCPFHNEKTPSFSVSPKRGIFKCFGCGVGGDVIHFVMKNENLTFHESVERLAQRANVILPEINNYDKESAKQRKEHNDLLYEINAAAAEFFYNSVKDSPKAVAYFKQRQLDSKIVQYFWLGFAPDSWNTLFDYLKEKGYTEGDIYDAGLIKKHETGRYYDSFRNRIMFTIFDVSNNIIGFGGRVMDDSKPKYLNSPDSPIFNKSKNLYALNIARHSKSDFVILCEGYMDAIALIKNGYSNTVATLGTALTAMQAKKLSNYFNEVVLCYDSDQAGRNATNRAITILRQYDIKISVLNLKAEKDPDEYLKSYGKARFDALLRQRKTDMVYLMDYFGENYDLKKSDDVISYISEMTDYLKLIQNDVELDVFNSMLSKRTGVQSSSILAQLGLRKAGSHTSNPSANYDLINVINKAGVPSNQKQYLEKTRSLLLGTLFYDQKLYARWKDKIGSDMFVNPVHKVLYAYIDQCFEKGEKVSNSIIIHKFDKDEDVRYVTEILAYDVQSEDTDMAVKDYITQISEKASVEDALEQLKDGKISLEEFNSIINNKR